MRGTPHHRHVGDAHIGIIPAYAGNTLKRDTANISIKDHPRVCGEHDCHPLTSMTFMGSSPRMRGTHVGSGRAGKVVGIIPAYAGNTLADSPFCPQARDHPRVCGEHPIEHNTRGVRLGSSPRMRGTHRRSLRNCHIKGIIPAYAGNTEPDCR